MSAHIPVIIYLQWHGDEDPEFLTEEEKSRKPTLDEVSWCWEQIFPYDIIYIRNDKYAELEQKNSALEQAFNDVCNQRDQLEAERSALQQRCEELVAALIELDDRYCDAGHHLTPDERAAHRKTLIKVRRLVAKQVTL